MVRISRLRKYIGTNHAPYELLTTAEEVLKFAAELIKPSVDHMAGEYAVSASAAGQLISSA